jgi:hypothetical protein
MLTLECIIFRGWFFKQIVGDNFDAISIVKLDIPSLLHKMVANLKMEDVCPSKVAMVVAKNNGTWEMDMATLTLPHSHLT